MAIRAGRSVPRFLIDASGVVLDALFCAISHHPQASSVTLSRFILLALLASCHLSRCIKRRAFNIESTPMRLQKGTSALNWWKLCWTLLRWNIPRKRRINSLPRKFPTTLRFVSEEKRGQFHRSTQSWLTFKVLCARRARCRPAADFLLRNSLARCREPFFSLSLSLSYPHFFARATTEPRTQKDPRHRKIEKSEFL